MPGPRLLRTGDEYGTSLSPLANDLFTEVVNLARVIGIASEEDKPSVAKSCWPRFEVIRHVLAGLEAGAGLGFAGRVPYLYNASGWASPDPAGYTSGQDPGCPRPVEVMTSIMAQCAAGIRGDSHFGSDRALKAVTFVVWRDGLTEGLQYFVDLVDFGFVPFAREAGRCLARILDCLVEIRARPELPELEVSRGWAAERLPGIASLKSGQDWRDASFARRASAPLTAADLYHEGLIRRLLGLAEQTRASSDLAEFILNQIRLGHALDGFKALERNSEATVTRIPVALRAISSQLEEIRADARSLPWIMASKKHAPTGSVLFEAARSILAFAGDSPVTRQRMAEQRVLAPRALGEIPPEGYSQLPEQWERLDYRLIHPLTALAGGSAEDLRFKRSTSPLGGQRISRAAREGILHAYHELMSAPQEERRAKATQAVAKYPWSQDFRLELAIAIDETGQPEEALPYAQSAAFLGPDDHLLWQSLAVILARCGADVESRLARAMGTFVDQFRSQRGDAAPP